MNKLIIGLAGEIASGKSTVADIIKNDFGGEALKFSGPLRDVLGRLGLPETRDNLQNLSTKLRELFGQDLLSKVLFSDVEKSNAPVIYIDGVRRINDIDTFKDLTGFILIYVETPLEICYERITKRSENVDDATKTLEEFKKESQAETELMIKDLKKHAHYVIDNSGTLEDLKKHVREIIEKRKIS